eukprot:365696-Chlamydomonas_euryale.AAC.7
MPAGKWPAGRHEGRRGLVDDKRDAAVVAATQLQGFDSRSSRAAAIGWPDGAKVETVLGRRLAGRLEAAASPAVAAAVAANAAAYITWLTRGTGLRAPRRAGSGPQDVQGLTRTSIAPVSG